MSFVIVWVCLCVCVRVCVPVRIDFDGSRELTVQSCRFFYRRKKRNAVDPNLYEKEDNKSAIIGYADERRSIRIRAKLSWWTRSISAGGTNEIEAILAKYRTR